MSRPAWTALLIVASNGDGILPQLRNVANGPESDPANSSLFGRIRHIADIGARFPNFFAINELIDLADIRQRAVGLRPAVAEELPGVADLADHVEIHVVDDELVLVAAGDLLDLAARVDEIALAVEFTDVPGRFLADAVDGADIDAVGDGGGRLLQLPEILAEASDGGGRIDDVVGAVERECAPAFGEMAVVADVDAELAIARLEHRELRRAGLEEEFFPEACHLRDVGLAVLAHVAAVGIDHRGGVVIDTGHRLLIDRDDDHHLVLLREVLHQL